MNTKVIGPQQSCVENVTQSKVRTWQILLKVKCEHIIFWICLGPESGVGESYDRQGMRREWGGEIL